MPRGTLGWLLWFAVAFGLFKTGLPRERFRTVQQRLDAGQWPGPVDAIRAYTTNDGDVRRYFAYAQAARGRPYQSYFVRKAEAWRKAFAAGEPYRPDEWPIVTPPSPLMPYLDYLVEYPPGFFLASLPPDLLAPDADSYVKLFQTLMAIALTASLMLMMRTLERLGSPVAPGQTMAWAALGLLIFGVVATHRYDAAVALAIATAAWAMAARRPILLGVALGIAITLKATPVLMVPVFAMHAARERRRCDLLAMVLAIGLTVSVIALPSFVSAGGRFVETLRYHADRPVQIESSWGAALGLLHGAVPGWVRIEKTFGSTNVSGRLNNLASSLSVLAILAGLSVVYFVTWRRLVSSSAVARGRVTLEGTAAAFVVFITCGKVCSPQYLVWLIPLGLGLSLTDGRRACLVLFMVLLALTQVIYPITYGQLEALRLGPCAIVAARNLVLLGWAALLLTHHRLPPIGMGPPHMCPP